MENEFSNMKNSVEIETDKQQDYKNYLIRDECAGIHPYLTKRIPAPK